MAAYFLPHTLYSPDLTISPEDLRNRRTLIDPEPMSGLRSPEDNTFDMSPISDDFPTPKAADFANRNSQQSFNELYDLSEDESEEVPLKCSSSIKKLSEQSGRSRRYPSIVIPSPRHWPTIQNFQKSASTPVLPAQVSAISPAPRRVMSMLAAHGLGVPTSSATPSLDGSLTSEELEHLSCPSTPDRQGNKDGEEWEPTVQLQPGAIETLCHLSSDEQDLNATPLIEIPMEMQQVQPSYHSNVETPVNQDNEPISALSIPSPSAFFSSLGGDARDAWEFHLNVVAGPSTSTAETFYGVPWSTQDKNGFQVASTNDGASEVIEVNEIEHSQKYQQEIQRIASMNIDRTTMWLSAQNNYMTALVASPVETETHQRKSSEGSSITSPSKKSVRFLIMDPEVESIAETIKATLEPIFYDGFVYLLGKSSASDAYIHRQTRGDAMHTLRRCMPKSHRDQLLGNYETKVVVRPAPSRPISSFTNEEEDSTALKQRIAEAQRERQALEQVQPAMWALQADKVLNGGSLLNSATTKFLNQACDAKILDLGGKVACDWAWQVASDFPNATVYTVNTASHMPTTKIAGPENQQTMEVPNLWTLPYPSNHFDVISARTLHAMLKTNEPAGKNSDEYDLCVKECMRVLKPNGFFEFSLLDADIVGADSRGQAMAVEFAFNLKTRGYDACASKNFLGRLNKAGFSDVKRAWTILPMGNPAQNWNEKIDVGAAVDSEKSVDDNGNVSKCSIGGTRDISAMTGLVGAAAWESWMLKLQMEMGREEDRLLEGVSAVIEEGAKAGSAWRVLKGCARKA